MQILWLFFKDTKQGMYSDLNIHDYTEEDVIFLKSTVLE